MDDDDLLVIRPSTTPRWADCMRRGAAQAYAVLVGSKGFRLRTVPKSIGAVVGTSVHAGAAEILKEKMTTGETPRAIIGGDAGVHEFVNQLEETDVLWDETTRNRNDATRQIGRMVGAYRDGVATKIMPLQVEQRFKAKIKTPSGLVILSGQTDNVAMFPSGPRDTKTGKFRSWYIPQYGSYSLLSRTEGFAVEVCTEDFIQRVAATKEQPPAQTREFDRRACETAAAAVVNLIADQVTRFAETGDREIFPMNPSSMLCADKWCPAHGTDWCTAWKEKA